MPNFEFSADGCNLLWSSPYGMGISVESFNSLLMCSEEIIPCCDYVDCSSLPLPFPPIVLEHFTKYHNLTALCLSSDFLEKIQSNIFSKSKTLSKVSYGDNIALLGSKKYKKPKNFSELAPNSLVFDYGNEMLHLSLNSSINDAIFCHNFVSFYEHIISIDVSRVKISNTTIEMFVKFFPRLRILYLPTISLNFEQKWWFDFFPKLKSIDVSLSNDI